MDTDDREDLRSEVGRLLAAALESDLSHVAEMDRRDVLHLGELQRREDIFEQELDTIRVALETRDLIGQAKGIIIATMRCSADEAFLLLKKQSQTENRK